MTLAEIVIQTDYGSVKPSHDVACILSAAKKRKDGQPDLRYTAGKLAQFCIEAAKERAQAEYLSA